MHATDWFPAELFAAGAGCTFACRNKPKYRKHNFAFRGPASAVRTTAAPSRPNCRKGKYVYYRCSHGRGKCSLPYMREEDVVGPPGRAVERTSTCRKRLRERSSIPCNARDAAAPMPHALKCKWPQVQRRLAALRARLGQMYEDKLDGKIEEELWTRKTRRSGASRSGRSRRQLSSLSVQARHAGARCSPSQQSL